MPASSGSNRGRTEVRPRHAVGRYGEVAEVAMVAIKHLTEGAELEAGYMLTFPHWNG